jgi:hypothetical protein
MNVLSFYLKSNVQCATHAALPSFHDIPKTMCDEPTNARMLCHAMPCIPDFVLLKVTPFA